MNYNSGKITTLLRVSERQVQESDPGLSDPRVQNNLLVYSVTRTHVKIPGRYLKVRVIDVCIIYSHILLNDGMLSEKHIYLSFFSY